MGAGHQESGVTLNSGRSKDHKSCQQEQTLLSRSSALASAKQFELAKRWQQSRTERRCWCRHLPHTGTWQSSTLSCSLHMPGDGHASLSWRKMEFATHHEDAGDDEIVGATLQLFQPSQSPSPGKAGRGRLLNTPTGVMAQHQTQLGCGDGEISIKAQGQQAAKWIHGVEIKKQRLQGQDRNPCYHPWNGW